MAKVVRATENVMVPVLVLGIVAMIFASVVARYVFGAPLQWSDELALGLFVWLTFVGAAVAWRNHDLLGVDILVDRLPYAGRRWIWCANYVVIALVCVGGIWWGTELAVSNLGSYTLNLELPRFVIDIGFPVGSALLLWHTLEYLVRVIQGDIPTDHRHEQSLETAI